MFVRRDLFKLLYQKYSKVAAGIHTQLDGYCSGIALGYNGLISLINGLHSSKEFVLDLFYGLQSIKTFEIKFVFPKFQEVFHCIINHLSIKKCRFYLESHEKDHIELTIKDMPH